MGKEKMLYGMVQCSRRVVMLVVASRVHNGARDLNDKHHDLTSDSCTVVWTPLMPRPTILNAMLDNYLYSYTISGSGIVSVT